MDYSVTLTERKSVSGFTAQPWFIAELSSGLAFRVNVNSEHWQLVNTPCCAAAFLNDRDRARRRKCSACLQPVRSDIISGSFGPDIEALFPAADPLTATVLASELTDRLRAVMRVDHEREPEAWLEALRRASGTLA